MVKKKILVVEDEGPMRMMLSEDLEAAGYEVFQAADGKEGLAAALKTRPDLVIADVLMPEMNGNELLKRVHATPGFSHIPFIILTGRGLMRDYFELMRVAAFIDKPFVTKNLLAKVVEVLGQAVAESEARQTQKAASLPKAKAAPPEEESETTTSEEQKGPGKYCNHCDHSISGNSSVCPRCGSPDIRRE
jgi:DNA-binding response OmpR family regulator